MATIGADRPGRIALALATAAALAAGGCAHLERGAVIAEVPPAAILPRVRVGLSVGAGTVTLGGGAALRLALPDGTPVARLGAGSTATARLAPEGILVQVGGATLPALEAATLAPEDTGTVRLDGRDYRGVVDLVRTAEGLVAANHVTVEEYLAGVVNAEMGRRAPAELEALRAQAVVSRTIAIRAIGRVPGRGYDLLATVADQAYLGVQAEQPQGLEAVAATRGIVLAWEGVPIDAFFHSTCGGQTAEPTEIFAYAGGRPYLRSVSDLRPDGSAYCAISPRYRWREEWQEPGLSATLRQTVPGGVPGRLREVAVTARGRTGRVQAIAVRHGAGERTVTGANLVRQVLRPAAGGMLRSSQFTLQGHQSGGDLARLVAEGSGAGHGVGMCQWGAVARSRDGSAWPEILAAYFPGAELARLY